MVGDAGELFFVGAMFFRTVQSLLVIERGMGDEGDHLLGEDVERVAQVAGGLDVALVHGLRDGGAGDEVCAVLGEDDALAGCADGVAGAADTLHAGGNGGRGFNLDDEVDGTHVDAEF